MAKVNITQAAKLAGISRTTLYNTYIKQGQITVSKDRKGNKQIDTSELLRIFGELNTEQLKDTNERSPTQHLTPATLHTEQLVCIAKLETENRMLKERMEEVKSQVSELKEQRQLDREQIQSLSTKLLEHHPVPTQNRRWWQILWK